MKSSFKGIMLYLLGLLFGVGGLLFITRGGQVPTVHTWIGLGIAVGVIVFELLVCFVLARADRRLIVGIVAANVTAVLGAVTIVLLDKIIGLRTSDALLGAAGFVLIVGGAALAAFLNRK